MLNIKSVLLFIDFISVCSDFLFPKIWLTKSIFISDKSFLRILSDIGYQFSAPQVISDKNQQPSLKWCCVNSKEVKVSEYQKSHCPLFQRIVNSLMSVSMKKEWNNLAHFTIPLNQSHTGIIIWVKVFKNGPSKVCGIQPLKNLKWYGML